MRYILFAQRLGKYDEKSELEKYISYCTRYRAITITYLQNEFKSVKISTFSVISLKSEAQIVHFVLYTVVPNLNLL